MKRLTGVMLAMLAGLATRDMPEPAHEFPLHGTWTLAAADKILPGGTLAHWHTGTRLMASSPRAD